MLTVLQIYYPNHTDAK